MDNITHTLTGALAAKLLPTAQAQRRTFFWLSLISVNLPDVDVLLRFVDYFAYIVNHRGITHSIVFAPVLALAPAFLFWRFGSGQKFWQLWLVANCGIFTHIFFDVITSFGTMLFAPFSDVRYSFDLMFIVDPFFTGGVALLLLLGRTWKSRSRQMINLAGVFVVLYLLIETVSHEVALKRVKSFVGKHRITAKYVSAIPQPLNVFRWNGLIQTSDGVHQAFFSVFDDSLALHEHRDSSNAVVATIMQSQMVAEYLSFTRHPWVTSFHEGGNTVVELRDLQFSIDRFLLDRFGVEEGLPPFVMQYHISPQGNVEKLMFDGRRLR